MLDDRGLSLIELIVVVLIMGIMATGAVMSMTVVYNADAERAVTNLTEILDKARTMAMAENDDGVGMPGSRTNLVKIVARITQDDKGDYYASVVKRTWATESVAAPTDTEVEKVKLCNYRVKISAAKIGGVSLKELTNNPGDMFEYAFKKSTGGIEAVRFDSDPAAHNEYLDLFVDGSDHYRIVFSLASGRCYVVD
ncbi:MAG: prepilin-type N-terminal cleavage/methylation domain-containing protein [Lachnospiraceae bacterium]|nr:prepilin-type N-terminal cleavage/methylation domain-containing protein [Lachnospiraceae bacterium]